MDRRRFMISLSQASGLIVSAEFSPCLAETKILGTVRSGGEFRLNRAPVRGHATLLDGALVESGDTPTLIQLDSGVRIGLSSAAKARIFRDRMVLESGAGHLQSGGFVIEAASLRVSGAASDRGTVILAGPRTVQVAAGRGSLRVRNSSGVLVARVEPGAAMAFEPQVTGPAAPSSFAGCVVKKDGKYMLYDQTTRILVELRGPGVEAEWGHRAQVIGTARAVSQPQGGSYQVLDVTSITRFGTGGCETVAAAVGAELPAKLPAARPAAPVASPGGMSAGTKVAIVGVIAGGGAAGAVLATQKSRSN